MYYVGSFFDHINEGTQCNSAVPKIFEQGGGSADIVSLISGGAEMTLIRAL